MGNQLGSDQQINTDANALESLNIADTAQTHVRWLASKAPNLQTLILANNLISDLSPLSTMTQLTTLDLSGNDQITDLTALAGLTYLTTLTVDPALQQQSDIITSGGSPETKRSQLISLSIGEIEDVAAGNADTIDQLSSSVTANVQTLTNKNQELENRIAELERKMNQLNTACLVGDSGFSEPASDDDLDVGEGGSRRLQQGSGCIVSSATAGLVSAAAIAAGVMFL
jgi:Leucine-rich repeat (LRR) protein